MRGLYELGKQDIQEIGIFSQLSSSAVKDFDDIKSTETYRQGVTLFVEKQEARGVYVLCGGAVKLSVSCPRGKTLILRIARAGELLGLMAVVSGQPHEVTAETMYPCQIAFVRRGEFLHFLARHPEAIQDVMQEMYFQYRTTFEQLRTLGLLDSAEKKLARLLLTWPEGTPKAKEGKCTALPMTHEEIGKFIGTSRETVTRTLSDFKVRRLVAMRGSKLIILNRKALEDFTELS